MLILKRRRLFSPAVHCKATSAFTPASLSPNLWIEPAKGGLFQSNAGTTAATANSDVVGYLPDWSGNSFTLTSVADDTTRPTLQGVGSHPYLNFDGSNDLLRRTSGLGSYAAGASSWFCVFRSNSVTIQNYLMSEGDGASTSTIYSLIASHNATASTAAAFIRSNTGPVTLLTIGQALQTGVFDGNDHVYGLIDDGTKVTPYLDGVAGTPFTYTNRGANALTESVFSIGALMRTSASNWWPGRVYGAVVKNAVLTGPQIASLTTYLGNLAGLSL